MKLAFVLLVVILLVLTAVYLVWNSSVPVSSSTTSRLTTTEPYAPVGVIWYLWYGTSSTGTGGLGSPSWNSTSCPGGGAVVDRPNIGYYVSDSNQTFRTQVGEMQSAGISFAVVSWWGPSTNGEAGTINNATLDLFRYLKGTNSTFKVALMVDAFPKACGSGPPDVPMATAEGYVQDTFASPFARWYFSWEGKPLLLFFNPLEPSPNSNFTLRTIGNRPNPVDWIFWDAPQNFTQGEGGTGVNMSNDVGDPYISPIDGEVTIVPRIDPYFNYAAGHQLGFLRFDPTLQLGLYRYEWNYLFGHRSQVKLVLIYSWNEYHERTEIEPHSDGNSTVPEGYLLNQTASYVGMLDPSGG